MTRLSLATCLLLIAGCGKPAAPPPTSAPVASPSVALPGSPSTSLAEARSGFKTKLVRRETAGEPLPEPPANLFRRVQYASAVGDLAALITPDPGDGKKRPAIVWITGGDCNTLDDSFWKKESEENDQTASGFREAGVVMMFPTLRGGNMNPGVREGFFGEVDDVLAARAFLANQPYVDPERIYLGGMSNGGTLVLLAAASTDKFRAIFSFGPVGDVSGYGREFLPFDVSDQNEVRLRSPIHWLPAIRSPTFILEGADDGNVDDLRALEAASNNPRIRCLLVPGTNHVTVLAPAARLLATKILRDDGPTSNINLTRDEVNRLARK